MASSRRVLIAMSDAGGGHRAVSRALAAALESQHSAEVRIEDVVALDPRGMPHRMIRLYPWAIRHAPLVYGIAYHSTNQRHLYSAIVRGGANRLAPRIVDLLATWEPAVVVTTHPLCNRLMLDALESAELVIPTVAVVTELVSVHVSWVDQRISRYAAATTEAKEAVVRNGAAPERVEITGLPIAESFRRELRSPEQIRVDLGLDPHRFTVLLVGGGEGAGRLAAQVRKLDTSDLDLQLIVVCGRNARLRTRLQRGKLRKPAAILGFVDTMPQLMRASDVVVTKGGPTTIAEALTSERPVIVTSVLPGQEQGNDRFVEEHGVGVGAGSPRALKAAVASLLSAAEQRQTMAARAAEEFSGDGAARVAELVVAEATRVGRWARAEQAGQTAR